MNAPNFQKINNIIALACAFALIIVTASIISKVIWKILEKDNAFPLTKVFDDNTETDINLSLPVNLFGTLGAPEKPKHSKIESTRLNLLLVGILAKPENPFVIIKTEEGKEGIYRINDLITPTTILKEVFSQYVILEHNGNIEKLVMNRKSIDIAKTVNTSGFQISAPNKSKLKQYLEELKTNPQNLLEVLSVSPNFNNSKLRGFIISPGKEKVLFEELGFQKNDIILDINNNELNNLSLAINLRKELATQKLFDFKIERKGQIKYLTLNLN